MSLSTKLGQWLYGIFFVVILPLLLWLWASATSETVRLPAIQAWNAAVVLAIAGVLLMASGMIALRAYGGGLPMNAFPPPRLVTRGIYRLVAHPIYIGFFLLCLAVAVGSGSATGLWLITPAVLLGSAALVWGYEGPDLRRRFGNSLSPPVLHLPENTSREPLPAERVSAYALVLLPWFVLYEAVQFLGIPPDAINVYMPFEAAWPVWQWTEWVYASAYIFVGLAPLFAVRSRDLREFCIGGWMATAVVTLLFVVLPFVAPPRPFVADTAAGRLLAWERTKDTAAAAFPSFHVIWALLAARLAARSTKRAMLRGLFWISGAVIAVSCITTGMHALVDVAGGIVIFFAVAKPSRTWQMILKGSQWFADSWQEWRIGPLRIINHGFYAAIAAFLGVAIVGQLVGSENLGSNLAVACSALAGAGLWAQLVEGSPRLLRPFGYYGSIVGGLLAVIVLQVTGHNGWLLLGAYAVAAPWIQAVGRLRCLANGCCHGRAAPPDSGIVYSHSQTRPCRIASLAGTSIFPTQTYSILWNLFTGPLLLRLWMLGTSPPFVAGLYLVLNGLGRFVEEAYRGEPQTPNVARLSLYQWMALASIITGAVLTTIRASASPPDWNWASVVAAGIFGALAGIAMGVDFPQSDRRFARLS